MSPPGRDHHCPRGGRRPCAFPCPFPLKAPGLLGNGLGTSVRAAGDASQPRMGRSELLTGMSRRNPSQGKENAPSNAEASALSHLISSFAAFRGRFNLLGSGKRLTLRRAGCIPMTRGSPQASGLILRQLPGTPAGKPVPTEARPCGTGRRVRPGALSGPCPSNPAGPRGCSSADTSQLLTTSLGHRMASDTRFSKPVGF